MFVLHEAALKIKKEKKNKKPPHKAVEINPSGLGDMFAMDTDQEMSSLTSNESRAEDFTCFQWKKDVEFFIL